MQEGNGKMFATTTRGRVLVREMRGQTPIITRAGRQFFKEFVAEIIPRVPVLRAVDRGVAVVNGLMERKHRVFKPPPPNDYVPFKTEVFREAVDRGHEDDDPEYYLLGLVPYGGRSAQEDVEGRAKESTMNWIQRRPTVAQKFARIYRQKGWKPTLSSK